MRSGDGGKSWQDHRPGAQPDVHSLAWHPHAPGRAYEAGGGGAAFSIDAGESWQPAYEGRDRHYTWSVTVDPDDPDRWYVSAASGPFAAHAGHGAAGRLYRWDGSWRQLELPDGSMPYALEATDALYAGLADGRILQSADAGETWRELARVGSLVALAAA
jgi:photosystem II stability/assembly factor-like uncharacterized protein